MLKTPQTRLQFRAEFSLSQVPFIFHLFLDFDHMKLSLLAAKKLQQNAYTYNNDQKTEKNHPIQRNTKNT